MDVDRGWSSTRHGQRGVSFTELMVVLFVVGLLAAATAGALTHRRSAFTAMARLTSNTLEQARFLAICRGVNHFFVVDPLEHVLRIYEDSGSTPASFDDSDRLVTSASWPASLQLALPLSGSLVDPLLGTTLSQAWSLPLPDSSARWGTTLLGVMVTPLGHISSAEATPRPIGTGTLVFSDGDAATIAVGVDGRAGTALPFGWVNGSWRRL